MTARLISDRDLQLIRRYDKRDTITKESLLAEDGAAYLEAFLMVLRNVTKEETVQYVMALIDEMLSANPASVALFFTQSEQHMSSLPDPYTLFVRLLQRSDWFTQQKACRLLAIILDCRPGGPMSAAAGSALGASGSANTVAVEGVEQVIVSFVDWLCSQLRRPTHQSQSVPTSISALACLLKEAGVRVLFHSCGGVALLSPLIRAGTTTRGSIQLTYEVGLCLWQLSYNHEACTAMVSSGVISGLVDLARTAQKEKVVRVALLTLKNLLKQKLEGAGEEMVELGLPKVVATRSLQSWGDDDMPELLIWLDEELCDHIQTLSSFEKYKKEVLSGTLEWSPMHTSEAFWLENVEKFEEKDFQILRVLLKLVEASREPRSLAVGCHDIGQFVTHHPHGRYIVSDLRGKELVMRLMVHPEAEVQKQALLCVQKLMLTKDKLEFLTSSRAGSGGRSALMA